MKCDDCGRQILNCNCDLPGMTPKKRTTSEDRLRQALQSIADLCGPPKMSETRDTAFVRIREIEKIVQAALEKKE